jgi:hypothetical protein
MTYGLSVAYIVMMIGILTIFHGDGAAPGRDVRRHARVEAPEMAAPHGDGDGR